MWALPEGHATQASSLSAPPSREYLPSLQAVQTSPEAAATAALHRPAGQLSQSSCFELLKRPAGQAVHESSPLRENFPGWHGMQADALRAGENVPGSQGRG